MGSKSRQHPKHKKQRKADGSSRSAHRQSTPPVSSSFSFPSISASRATILAPEFKNTRAEYRAFIWGLLGVCGLVLLGGGQHPFALGFALILPGVALLLRPPTHSLGKWLDIGIYGVLGALLLAFLPIFLWQKPEWRRAATDVLGIELPPVLTVQPWISFEALLLVVAGSCWFYAAAGWRLNSPGIKRVFLWLSCFISVLAVIVIAGNVFFWRYPGASDAATFSFFPNPNLTANFIGIGGVLTFAYAMEGLNSRKLLHLFGLLASVLCLGALVSGASLPGLLLYFGGIYLWFICVLRRTKKPLIVKVGLPILLLIAGVHIAGNEATVTGLIEEVPSSTPRDDEEWVLVQQDMWEMFKDSPISGFGIGTISEVFPQYRDVSRNDDGAVHPASDLLWLAVEGGLIAVCFFAVLLFAYFRRCKESLAGKRGACRMIALIGTIMFLLHGLFDVSGHSPGTAYFAIIFAVMGLPKARQTRATFKPVVWRVMGSCLLCFGLFWILGSMLNLPTYSSIAYERQAQSVQASRSMQDLEGAERAVSKMIKLRPLNWSGYFQRAELGLLLGVPHSEVASDFDRARFLEPNIAEIAYEEGRAWLPYDLSRTVAAWTDALNHKTDGTLSLFAAMLKHGHRNDALLEHIVKLSYLDTNYRAFLILNSDLEMFRQEVRKELSNDPSLAQFTVEQRAAMIERCIIALDFDLVEAYLSEYEDHLDGAWLLWSKLRISQARDDEAVEIFRNALAVPSIPEVAIERNDIEFLERVFWGKTTNNLTLGTALLEAYLQADEYFDALRVTSKLLELPDAPQFVYYWHAEVLYQLGDYYESWSAFEVYQKQLK